MEPSSAVAAEDEGADRVLVADEAVQLLLKVALDEAADLVLVVEARPGNHASPRTNEHKWRKKRLSARRRPR
jgi:hypothetical protein